jgi:hypothetical protein
MVVREAIAAHPVAFRSARARRGLKHRSPQLISRARQNLPLALALHGGGLRTSIRSNGVIFEQMLGL